MMYSSVTHTLPIKDGENEDEVKDRDESKEEEDAHVHDDNTEHVKS